MEGNNFERFAETRPIINRGIKTFCSGDVNARSVYESISPHRILGELFHPRKERVVGPPTISVKEGKLKIPSEKMEIEKDYFAEYEDEKLIVRKLDENRIEIREVID